MNEDFMRAKHTLENTDSTFALCRNSELVSSRERGIRPLLELADSGKDYSGYCAADKVVAKAAAFMYVVLGVKQVYAAVMSRAAAKTLEANGVEYFADKLVDAVKNRDGTGVCPMEQCVAEIDDADKAVCALRKRISELQQQSRANIINKIAKK